MKNQNKNSYDEIAENEPAVKACDLLAEIKPLLEDYFMGDISFNGEAITYRLPNGQKFKLTAEESA